MKLVAMSLDHKTLCNQPAYCKKVGRYCTQNTWYVLPVIEQRFVCVVYARCDASFAAVSGMLFLNSIQ